MKTPLSCKKIAPLLYLTPEEQNPAEAQTVRDHIATCADCRAIHEKMLSTRQLTIDHLTLTTKSTDIPPQLKEISFQGNRTFLTGSVKSTWGRQAFLLRQVRIVSSIASVLLLCLFLSEQAVSVQKIARLEKRLEQAVPSATSGLIERLTQVQGSFTLASLASENAGIPGSYVRLNPQSLPRIKYLINKGLISIKTADPVAAVWAHQMLTVRHRGVMPNFFPK